MNNRMVTLAARAGGMLFISIWLPLVVKKMQNNLSEK
jgi:hypothetical protein